MYKHCDSNDEYVSLHDCRATKVTFENGVLKFVFQDGFWITQGHPDNMLHKTDRTGESEVKFLLENGDEYDVTLYVFEEREQETVREEWELDKFMECINKKNCALEFLYQYKGYHSMIIECWLWFDEEPYHKECELKLSLKDVEYYWNHLCEDAEW